jgi:hypothetical protein
MIRKPEGECNGIDTETQGEPSETLEEKEERLGQNDRGRA